MRSTLAAGFVVLAIVAPALTACSNENEESAVAPSTVVASATTVAVLTAPQSSVPEMPTSDAVESAVTAAPRPESTVASEATMTAAQDKSGTARELCGSSDIGLAVWAANTDCATATEVQSAFHAARGASRNATLTVTVDGRDWDCAELQGQINPYLECVHGGETVRLTS